MTLMYCTLKKSLKDVFNVLNEKLKYLSVWFKVNKLSFNFDKTN